MEYRGTVLVYLILQHQLYSIVSTFVLHLRYAMLVIFWYNLLNIVLKITLPLSLRKQLPNFDNVKIARFQLHSLWGNCYPSVLTFKKRYIKMKELLNTEQNNFLRYTDVISYFLLYF